jgi:hypothetical protein
MACSKDVSGLVIGLPGVRSFTSLGDIGVLLTCAAATGTITVWFKAHASHLDR